MSRVVENFGKYVLLEKLAAGGMAEVYLAKSTGASGVSKFLAVKRILPQYSDNPDFIDMFKEEAKIAVNLNHGNVVSIFDFGIELQQFFLVMEYVEGQNLRQVLNHLKKEGKNFSIDQIVYIIKEIAAGLDHAHRCLDGASGKPLNITHRDMSPQNIMVSFEGEVKIVDFGIAKAESQMEHTRAGTIKGKFGYMSPEQADGQAVDLRTDIFSLGIVLWELLANDRLFTSNSEAGTLRKIRECQIPSLRKLNPAVPPELERICNKALAKDKSLRYQTSAAFHRDLNRFLNTQYPEFSPHDFSVFMKSAFSEMFIENRKKLIEFAKIQGTYNGGGNSNNDKTMVTATATLTGTSDQNENDAMEALNLNASTPSIDLSDLKKKGLVRKGTGTFTASKTNTGLFIPPTGTQSSIRRPMPPPKQPTTSSNGLLYTVIGLLLVGSGYYYWQTQKSQRFNQRQAEIAAATTPTVTEGRTESSSKQPVALLIESEPRGARIYIDGQDTNMVTPARKTLDQNQEFTLSLRMDGYQYYEKREVASYNGYQIKGTLLPVPKMGYINLEIINGGSTPVVFINKQRVNETLPLKNYAVPAGAAVTIQAHNPFTGFSAEQVLTVGANQRRQVNLILSQRKPTSDKSSSDRPTVKPSPQRKQRK